MGSFNPFAPIDCLYGALARSVVSLLICVASKCWMLGSRLGLVASTKAILSFNLLAASKSLKALVIGCAVTTVFFPASASNEKIILSASLCAGVLLSSGGRVFLNT